LLTEDRARSIVGVIEIEHRIYLVLAVETETVADLQTSKFDRAIHRFILSFNLHGHLAFVESREWPNRPIAHERRVHRAVAQVWLRDFVYAIRLVSEVEPIALFQRPEWN
jgi:hypothetical protein